jgi:hypothetical protein
MGDEAQRRGFVYAWWGVGTKNSSRREGRGPRFVELFLASTIKVTSMHGCFDDLNVLNVFNVMAANIVPYFSARLQTHFGNHVGCLGNLVSFGIPREMIPITKDGDVSLVNHEQHIRRLQQREFPMGDYTEQELEPKEKLISSPGLMDVVMGRGRRGTKLPGNVLLRRLQEEHYKEYNSGIKGDKTCISLLILS